MHHIFIYLPLAGCQGLWLGEKCPQEVVSPISLWESRLDSGAGAGLALRACGGCDPAALPGKGFPLWSQKMESVRVFSAPLPGEKKLHEINCSALRRQEMLAHTTARLNLEDVCAAKCSRRHKHILCDFTIGSQI